MRDLKNCPKCESKKIEIIMDNNGLYSVKCMKCGYENRCESLSIALAVRFWNGRIEKYKE